ncbi:MAG TPA: Gldg family protein [Tepidisphaeraceae bacterium]|nr:Gldg family protein [Tepidisphaeraceae bacterium]
MNEATAKSTPAPESQKQRWVKYGANVVLASVVVILLAIILTYLAQRTNQRLDTTASGLYSLKPQTVNIIRDNKQKIKLVSLYARNTTAPGAQPTDETDYAQVVDDLLDEYRRKGRNIEVESIDPIANPTKVDDLINEVMNKYGGEVAKYREVVDAHKDVYEQVRTLTAQQLEKVNALSMDSLAGNESAQGVSLAMFTVQEFPQLLKQSETQIKRRLEMKPPDYKGATASIERTMDALSQMTGQIVDNFTKAKDDPKVPEPVRQYMTASLPTYAQIKKIADEQVAKIRGLGELKLDDLRQKLREQNAILVMGENDMRSLSAEQVWKRNDEELRRLRPGEEVTAKAKFSGEQQITSAILSLTAEKKPKVVFVRPGGGPLTESSFFQQGPFSRVADRLREYNFEVLEKDLSGSWAMQAQMQGRPAAPEPSDEEIKDAVWIVLSIPTQGGPMGPTPPIAPRVAQHLKEGGSAMFLFFPQSDDMHEALAEWGIEVQTGAMVVHEPIPSQGGPSGDFIEDAQRIPYIFVVNNYADHPITKPLQSLDFLMLQMLPVKTRSAAGYDANPLLAAPSGAWGESNIEAAMRSEPIQLDPPKQADSTPGSGGDIPGPLFVAAASEKQGGGGRVVAIGGLQVFINGIIDEPDRKLLARERPIIVSRFPGNAELFANSVFWLAKMEPLIAISPAAMEVSRIKPMSEGTLKAWRIGALLVGLPGLVIAAGAFVWFARRD